MRRRMKMDMAAILGLEVVSLEFQAATDPLILAQQ